MKKTLLFLVLLMPLQIMAKNTFDITTSGHLTYKQLQEANLLDFDYESLSDDLKEIIDSNWDKSQRPTAADYYSSEPIYARSSTGDFGESMWDPKTIGLEGVNRVNDIRAENRNQSVKEMPIAILFIIGIILGSFFSVTIIYKYGQK